MGLFGMLYFFFPICPPRPNWMLCEGRAYVSCSSFRPVLQVARKGWLCRGRLSYHWLRSDGILIFLRKSCGLRALRNCSQSSFSFRPKRRHRQMMKTALQRINPEPGPSFPLFSKDGKLNFYTWTELGPWRLCGVGLRGGKGKTAL